jgi:tetrahydromethanopterin S-methyltransferase subunit A
MKEKIILEIVFSKKEGYKLGVRGSLNELAGCVPILKGVIKKIENVTEEAVDNLIKFEDMVESEEEEIEEEEDVEEIPQKVMEERDKTDNLPLKILRYIG